MAGIHLIIGEDDYLVSETAGKLIGEGTGLETIDSRTSTNESLQLADLREADASFSTPPFLEPVKVTWWKNVTFLPHAGKAVASEAVKAALEKFAEKLAASRLPDNQTFIISGPHLLMNSVFAKTLKPVAEIATFGGGKPWEQEKHTFSRTIEFASEAGFSFAPGAAESFVRRVGNDTRSILSEIGKLRDYLGERKSASTEDVANITSQGVGVEPAIWSVTDAIGERNIPKMLAAAHPFESENGFAVMMTSVVEKFFRQMIEIKDARSRGIPISAESMGISAFVFRKNVGFLANWTLRELRVARFRFVSLREKAVSTSGSADASVITELIRVCRRQ